MIKFFLFFILRKMFLIQKHTYFILLTKLAISWKMFAVKDWQVTTGTQEASCWKLKPTAATERSGLRPRPVVEAWQAIMCSNHLFRVNFNGPHGAFWVNTRWVDTISCALGVSTATCSGALTPSLTLSTIETAEQLPTAETHLTITQFSYVTQA